MQLRLWLHRPSAGGPALQFAVHLAGKLRIILRLAGVYIQEFLLVAQLTQPSARSRTGGVGLSDTISRKQVASYPLQVARVSDFVNLRIKVIGDVGAKSHVNPARRIDGEGARHIPSPRLVIPVPDDDQRSLRWS